MKKTLPEISIVIAVASLIVILFACLGALIAMTVHGVDINIWINNLENPTERAGAYIATAIGIHAIATFYK